MNKIEILTWCATLLLLVIPTSLAQDGSTEDGIVVSAGAGKLSMKDQQGKEKSYNIDATVKVTVNGKPGKLEDLTAGMQIRVVLDKDHKLVSVSTIDTKKGVEQT
jgi:hypothetical protein